MAILQCPTLEISSWQHFNTQRKNSFYRDISLQFSFLSVKWSCSCVAKSKT